MGGVQVNVPSKSHPVRRHETVAVGGVRQDESDVDYEADASVNVEGAQLLDSFAGTLDGLLVLYMIRRIVDL